MREGYIKETDDENETVLYSISSMNDDVDWNMVVDISRSCSESR
jgi:hypothetical protein